MQSMTSTEFTARYRLLKCVAERGARSFLAQQIALGRMVMVHYLDAGDPEEQLQLLAGIEALDTAARQKVLEIVDIEGTAVAVTSFVPSFQDFPTWLAANAVKGFVVPPAATPAPVAPTPAPEKPVDVKPAAPGEFTRIFQGLGPQASESLPTPTPAPAAPPSSVPQAPLAQDTSADFTDAQTLIIPALAKPQVKAAPAAAPARPATPSPSKPTQTPESPKKSPGEFTRMFSVLGEEPATESRQQQADQTAPRLHAPSPDVPNAPASPAAAPAIGGFTAIFGKASPSSPTPTTTPAVTPPSTPVIPLPVAPPPSPLPPPPPLAAVAPTAGAPVSSFADRSSPPVPPVPPVPTAAPGEFTQLFQKLSPAANATPVSPTPVLGGAIGPAAGPPQVPPPAFGGHASPATPMPLAPPPLSFGTAAPLAPPPAPDAPRAFEVTPRADLAPMAHPSTRSPLTPPSLTPAPAPLSAMPPVPPAAPPVWGGSGALPSVGGPTAGPSEFTRILGRVSPGAAAPVSMTGPGAPIVPVPLSPIGLPKVPGAVPTPAMPQIPGAQQPAAETQKGASMVALVAALGSLLAATIGMIAYFVLRK